MAPSGQGSSSFQRVLDPLRPIGAALSF